jgi:hypothetical protein
MRLSRRELFSILPAGAAGCLGCMCTARCAAQAGAQSPAHTWTEKSDMTWEAVFRFAYQANFIPQMKALEGKIGSEKFISMIQEAMDERVKNEPPEASSAKHDLASWTAGLETPPPLFQHALVYEIVEDTPKAFEVRISKCLWAKTFRDEDAAALGYAAICYPDFGVARGYSPKMKLVRTKTLMQGYEYCNHRYEWSEA